MSSLRRDCSSIVTLPGPDVRGYAFVQIHVALRMGGPDGLRLRCVGRGDSPEGRQRKHCREQQRGDPSGPAGKAAGLPKDHLRHVTTEEAAKFQTAPTTAPAMPASHQLWCVPWM